jgi:Ribonuclease G/E
MKGTTVALDWMRDRPAAVRIVNGRLDDVLVDPDPARHFRPGAILRAVPDRPLKGAGGHFLRLPDGRTGFLRQTKGIAPGRPLLVQTNGYAEPGKALPVTTRLLFKGRYAIVTPDAPGLNISRRITDENTLAAIGEALSIATLPEGAGAIIRSAAERAALGDVRADLAEQARRATVILSEPSTGDPEVLDAGADAHDLARREWLADEVDDTAGAFDRHGVPDMLAAMARPEHPLTGDASLVMEPTRALIAIDVNTGADNSPAAGLRANIAAARDLPRLLRCKGLGGQITIDLAPLAKRGRPKFESALRSAFRNDPIETALVGWTPLGHYELQRKRDRLPLGEVLS